MARRSRLAARRKAREWTQESLAYHLGVARNTVSRWEQGLNDPEPWNRRPLADALDVSVDELDDLLRLNPALAGGQPTSERDWTTVVPPSLDDLEALELVRRVEASDAGPSTLDNIDRAVDRLCRSYTNTQPADLLVPLRGYRGYVTQLLDGRATLVQRRELMVYAGWLCLLAAICDIDLHEYRAAAANLDAVRAIANEAGYPLLAAWTMETEAWQAITDGHFARAVQLCAGGLELVPHDSSARVQLSVQQARASSRLGLKRDTHQLLDDAARSLDRMPTQDSPEHHFHFDPRKLVGYTATTLAWLGDEDAEEYARQAVDQYDVDAPDGRWARRLALARIDLALVLARTDQPAEATHLGHLAMASGRMVPSNLWRLSELDRALGPYLPTGEVEGFHDQYLDTRRQLTAHTA